MGESEGEEVRAVLRLWQETGAAIALFPDLPADLTGRYCLSYEHVGQHGAADYAAVVAATRPAAPDEYRELKAELEDHYGYRLSVRKRR